MKNQWWHDKIAYQIYPKSFKDLNGDGIGDIKGIISKLDYLKDLGVDIIWISPIYKSPFVDQGYDIADYYQIDKIFGSMEDMEELIREIKDRNMFLLMDLVVNHCSDQHEWFKEAIKDPDGKYGKYFIIKDKSELNNWRSYFGGSVWEKLPGHDDKYYLHLFAKEQPDLNWNNPEVVDEVYTNIKWWLDKGIDGFRIDAIVNIKKDESYADVEIDGPDNLGDCRKMLSKASGLVDTLNDMKMNTFEKYNALTVAELFEYDKSNISDYIGDKGCFSTIFDFSAELIGKSVKGWYDNKKVSIKEYRDAIFYANDLSEDIGYMCNIIENHDEPRGVSRFLNEFYNNIYAKKSLATVFMMRRGMPFIFQGQEIGMTNRIWKSIDEIDDVNTIDQYKVAHDAGISDEENLKIISAYSRDNARTPMQWSDEEYAGFSDNKPWLTVNENYKDINVESQLNDDNSLLSYYKELIKLRKAPEYKDVIVHGKMIPEFTDNDNIIAFYRVSKDKKILVIASFSDKEVNLVIKDNIKRVLINNYSELGSDKKMVLKPFEACVLEL